MFGMAHLSFKWPLFLLQHFLYVYSGASKVGIHEGSKRAEVSELSCYAGISQII